MRTNKYTISFNKWEIRWRDIEEDKIFSAHDKEYLRALKNKELEDIDINLDL